MQMLDKKSLAIFSFFLLLAAAINTVFAEVIAPFAGSLGTQIRYTPENNFENGYFINLSSSMRKQDGNFEFRATINNLYAREGQLTWYFPNHRRDSNWRIGTFYLRNTSPLGNGLGASTMTIGDVDIRYSPYTVYLQGSTYNRSRRGVTLQKFKLGEFDTDSFLVWMDSIEKPLYGFKTSWNKNQFRINYIAAQQVTKNATLQSIDETVTSLELNKTLPAGSFAFLTAKQYKDGEDYEIFQATISRNITNKDKIQFIWRDFQPGYRPSFCDHTPKYDNSQKRPYNWNPVDRFANRKGLTIGLDSRGKRGSINFSKEYYLDRDYYRNKTYREATVDRNEITWNLSFPTLTGKIIASHQRIELDNPFQQPSIESTAFYIDLLSREYKVGSKLASNCNLFLWVDDSLQLTDYLGNYSEVISEQGYRVNLNFTSDPKKYNFFIGVSGIEHFDGFDFYKSMGLNYKHPSSGLDLVIRLTNPNFDEKRAKYSLDPYDRRFGFMDYPDNIIQIRNVIRF